MTNSEPHPSLNIGGNSPRQCCVFIILGINEQIVKACWRYLSDIYALDIYSFANYHIIYTKVFDDSRYSLEEKVTDILLTTKFYIPPTRPELVPRKRLIDKLNEGLHRKMTLISTPAGYGKTTLVTEWLSNLQSEATNGKPGQYRIAWLSLDEGDNDLVRFLTYIIAALNQVEELGPELGKTALGMIQSPQSPPTERYEDRLPAIQ